MYSISIGTRERVRSRPDVPGFPDLSEPLTDGALALRPSAERDIPEVLIAYQDDRRLHLRLGEERPPTGAELGRRVERAELHWRTGEAATLTLVEPPEDVCRGEVRVQRLDWENRRVQLTVWVAPQRRGQGLGRRALRLASQWLLDAGGLERVGLMTEPDNAPLIAAARAAGFAEEGVLRGHEVGLPAHGRAERVDRAVLSRVRGDLRR